MSLSPVCGKPASSGLRARSNQTAGSRRGGQISQAHLRAHQGPGRIPGCCQQIVSTLDIFAFNEIVALSGLPVLVRERLDATCEIITTVVKAFIRGAYIVVASLEACFH